MTTEVIITPAGQELHLVETTLFSAPLGLRFWDAAVDRQIVDGLRVTATPVAGGPTRVARQGSSGIFGFVGLPTTAAAELGPVEDFGATDDYRIDVIDLRGRFLTMATIEPAPRALSATVDPIFLYSSPQRPAVAGFAAVRASLLIENTAIPAATGLRTRPAAHAMVEIVSSAGTTVGFSDAAGELLMYVPLPDHIAGQPLHEQTAAVTLQAFFDPTLHDVTSDDPIPLIEQLLAQPSRAHLAGDVIAADGSFEVGLAEPTVLSSSASSYVLLQPL